MCTAKRFYFLVFQGTVASLLTTSQLHKRAERVAQMAVEQGRLSSGDNVALLFTPGMFLNFWKQVALHQRVCSMFGLAPITIFSTINSFTSGLKELAHWLRFLCDFGQLKALWFIAHFKQSTDF